MKLSQFKYDLPKELVADHPAARRDESRLMVVNRRSGEIEHKVFKDIIEYFDEGDVFILNNTKVFPARLKGYKEKTNARIDVFLLRELNQESRLWDVLVDPARKIRIGNKLYFGNNEELVAEVIDNTTSRGRTLRFLFDGSHDEFKKLIRSLGQTPLPDDLIYRRDIEPADEERYQTIYAKAEGAVAAPTAGLHFSRELLKRMEIQGINFAEVTLHAGLGNFRSIEVEDLSKHKMDSEEMSVSQEAANIINHALDNHKKVCCVGTTTVKACETAMTISRRMKPYSGWTNRFIFPPHTISIPNAMITNFHAPLSSMMMLTASFSGFDLLKRAYQIAVEEKYHFLTYGDAMLII